MLALEGKLDKTEEEMENNETAMEGLKQEMEQKVIGLEDDGAATLAQLAVAERKLLHADDAATRMVATLRETEEEARNVEASMAESLAAAERRAVDAEEVVLRQEEALASLEFELEQIRDEHEANAQNQSSLRAELVEAQKQLGKVAELETILTKTESKRGETINALHDANAALADLADAHTVALSAKDDALGKKDTLLAQEREALRSCKHQLLGLAERPPSRDGNPVDTTDVDLVKEKADIDLASRVQCLEQDIREQEERFRLSESDFAERNLANSLMDAEIFATQAVELRELEARLASQDDGATQREEERIAAHEHALAAMKTVVDDREAEIQEVSELLRLTTEQGEGTRIEVDQLEKRCGMLVMELAAASEQNFALNNKVSLLLGLHSDHTPEHTPDHKFRTPVFDTRLRIRLPQDEARMGSSSLTDERDRLLELCSGRGETLAVLKQLERVEAEIAQARKN